MTVRSRWLIWQSLQVFCKRCCQTAYRDLKKQELKDFYEMMPEKFNNKTNGITQSRFLLHANPLLAEWVTEHVGADWITDLPKIKSLLFMRMMKKHSRSS